jgi:hypothetical protein
MRVYVAPVSGGGFSVQLALLVQLCRAKIVPDIALGVSGGSAALNIAMLCDFDADRILQHVSNLNHRHIVKTQAQGRSLLPSWVNGMLRGSMYEQSDQDPFEDLVNAETDLSAGCELWIAAFNRIQNHSVLFTNKHEGKSILKRATPYMNSRIRYLGGDYQQLRLATKASSAVPGVMAEVIIDREPYADGGVVLTSCFPVFADNLRELATNDPLHITYIVPTNMAYPSLESDSAGVLETAKWAVNLLTSGAADRAFIIGFLYGVPGFQHGKHSMKYQELESSWYGLGAITRATEFLSRFPATVMEICPVFNRSVNYTDFSSGDLDSVMALTQETFIVKMHWFE